MRNSSTWEGCEALKARHCRIIGVIEVIGVGRSATLGEEAVDGAEDEVEEGEKEEEEEGEAPFVVSDCAEARGGRDFVRRGDLNVIVVIDRRVSVDGREG